MGTGFDPRIALLSGGGVAAGLLLLWRGMGGYRLAAQIGGTASSRISSVAVGEVRIAGTIEGAELELTSPILRHQCVYFRATVWDTSGNDRRKTFSDERSVGFRVRDASGVIRVFPRGARWDIPAIDSEGTGFIGGGVIGTDLPPGVLDAGGGGHSYEEARLEVGDPVTIIGTVLPFEQLPDPLGADEDTLMAGPGGGEDSEVAADIAEARAAGLLTGDPDDAWGNAAIPGFGIGQPVRQPELDPAAHPEPLATDEQADAARRQFDIEPRSLVLAVGADAPMLVAAGLPAAAESRNSSQFIIGLGGALLAIASAIALAFVVTGGFR